jgi:hypothetical protein
VPRDENDVPLAVDGPPQVLINLPISERELEYHRKLGNHSVVIASGTKTDSRPTELDVLIAVAALEADEPAVLALLEAEATRRKRPGLDFEAKVDTVGIAHLQRMADVAVAALPHHELVAPRATRGERRHQP